MEKKLINLYGPYLKQKYGSPVYRVGVDAGFSCPNRSDDRTQGGCFYCDTYGASAVYNRKEGYGELPDRFDPETNSESEIRNISIASQIRHATAFLKERYKAEKFLLYFQSFSSTYSSPANLNEIYMNAFNLENFEELIVSTRPDCINDEIANVLAGFIPSGDVWAEIGLQSIHDKTLDRINRGHTFEDFKHAFKILKKKSIKVCVHIILGLPGETFRDIMKTVEYIAHAGIDAVKFHNLHIPYGTKMYDEYLGGEIKAPGPEHYMEWLIAALERIPPDMIVQRLTCDTPKIRRAAPRQFWKKTFFYDKIKEELAERASFQGKSYINN